MRFEEPHILIWIWAAVLGGIVLFCGLRRKLAALKRFANEELLKEIAADYDLRRDIFKRAMLVLVLVLGIVALARPQWGFEWQEIKRKGLDILIALDTSRSMLTQDVKPNRLERSKLAVRDLMKKIKGDRLGLIAFAGDAFLVCPLTTDYQGFLLSLEDVDTRTIPRGGTNIAVAIEEAIREYDDTPAKYKAVIILTDGENLEGDPMPAARRAKEKGIKIYTVGVGTQEGELVKVQNEEEEWEFLKDKDGNFVKSRLNEKILQDIALTTGGIYVRSSGAEFGLDLIYERELAGLEGRDIKSRMEKKYFERFQIPLAIALALLLLESWALVRRKRFLLVVLVGTLMFFSLPGPAWSLGEGAAVNEGNRLYRKGEYGQALEQYRAVLKKNEKSQLIHFNAGTAAYQTKNYDEAVTHLEKSLLSDDVSLQTKAHHNLGNAHYRRGKARENLDVDKAVAELEKSLEHYRRSLSLQPEDDKDEDTQYNYEFVKKELERLKQKQQQQKQNQQNQQKQPQNQKDQQSGDSQSQSPQNRPSEPSDKGQQQPNQNQSPPQNPDQPSSGDQQDKEQQQAQEAAGESQRNEPSSSKSSLSDSQPRALSSEEAERMLNDYQQNEEPRGLLNFMKGKGRQEETFKDW